MSIAEAIQTPFDLYETQYGESEDFRDDESEDFLQDPHLMLQALEQGRQQVREGKYEPVDVFFERFWRETRERRMKS